MPNKVPLDPKNNNSWYRLSLNFFRETRASVGEGDGGWRMRRQHLWVGRKSGQVTYLGAEVGTQVALGAPTVVIIYIVKQTATLCSSKNKKK